MEALPTVHNGHQSLCSSFHYSSPSPTQSSCCSLLRAPLSPSSSSSSSSPPSSSIRASSSSHSNSLPSPPSSDPPQQNFQYSEPTNKILPEFPPALRLVPSLATVTAASAFLFLGFCRNGFVNRPVTLTTTLSSIETIPESLDFDGKNYLDEIFGGKPYHVQSTLHLKLKERIPVVHSFNKAKTDDDDAWQVLKAQVFSCSEQLEMVRVGFEEILDNERDLSKASQDCVLEYLEKVDKYIVMLKGIKLAMVKCERENGNVKYYLRLWSKLIEEIRVFEGNMVGALKQLKELEQE